MCELKMRRCHCKGGRGVPWLLSMVHVHGNLRVGNDISVQGRQLPFVLRLSLRDISYWLLPMTTSCIRLVDKLCN